MKRKNDTPSAVLLVDDEVAILDFLEIALKDKFEVFIKASSSKAALKDFEEKKPDLVILDLNLGGDSGLDLLDRLQSVDPEVPVIVSTGEKEDLAKDCLRRGAVDFLTKPVTSLRLVTSVDRALDAYQREKVLNQLQKSLLETSKRPQAFDSMLTVCNEMERLFQLAGVVATTPRDVLITGETGTGKDLMAKAIHDISGRPGEYVAVNVAGLDDNHFSDTLFGHLKGSFTGATRDRQGLVEKARGGTLFLDEIGDLSIPSQVKLLRLLQEREFLPIGSDEHVKVDIRFVVATSRPLDSMMEEGTFRRDLYFRLRAQQLHLPALRERRGDVSLLWEHFLERAASQLGRKAPRVSDEAIGVLEAHNLPGNVRELEALAFQAASAYKYLIEAQQMEGLVGGDTPKRLSSGESKEEDFGRVLPTVDEMIDRLILEALKRTEGNQTQAAKLIGMSRRGMISRMRRNHLDV
jgi:DNA-binding NtrC family response regulator